MIGRIRGTLVELGNATALVDTGAGVAHEVLLPAYLASALEGRRGQEVELRTFEWLESVGQGSSFLPRLVGFRTIAERRIFELLTSVKGLGYRRALRALAAEPAEVARRIASRDARALTKLPEIGKKLAEQIVMDLAEKAAPFLSEAELAGLERTESTPPSRQLGDAALEAIATLEALGEASADAERRVRRALGHLSPEADTQAIVRAALGAGDAPELATADRV